MALSTENFKLGLELAEAAIPVFKKFMGDRIMDDAQAVRNRASAERGLADYEASLRDFRDTLAIYDAVATPISSPRIRTLLSMVDLLCRLHRPEDTKATADGR